MRRFKWVLVLCAFVFSACASRQVYELPKVQRNFAENLVKAESLAQKAANDYRDKKALYDNLAQGKAQGFRDADTLLAQSLRQMYELLQEIGVAKKEMTEASGDVASLSYQRSTVRGDEKEYPLVSEAMKRFESANARLNQSLLNYSRESNSMADLIAAKKLYFTFDVIEFQRRVQKAVLTSQDNQKSMQKEILKAEGYLNNWSKPSGQAEAEVIFEEMKRAASEYSDQAQKLAGVSKDMQSASLAQAKVNSVESIWPQVQEVAGRLDMLQAELVTLNDKFVKLAETFRKSR